MFCAARTVVRRVWPAGLLAGALALSGAAGASAASPVVTVGTPFASGPPAVAVDSSGDAIVAWNDNKDLGGSANFVQYCVVPSGASACSHSGNLIPADQAGYIDGTQVLVDGSTIVILADVYGAQGNDARRYQPEQEWQSTDGGATFSIVNGGLSVASANLSADTGPLSAVSVPGTGVLGYGWETAAGPPTFSAFPLASPPECSQANPCPFATLEPNTNPDTLTNAGGQFAAQAGASPGVLGVFNTLFNDGGPFSCPSSHPDGLAFVYGSGNQSASNSYNLSPGTPGSAWTGPAQQGECGIQYFGVAGGPAGFGILGDDEGTRTTVFQHFDQATKTFGPRIRVSKAGELFATLSEDGAGGLYGTYMNTGSGGPVVLSYSADGGKTWTGPSTLSAYNGQANVTSAVNAAGQGWAAWQANGSVYAQPFTSADAGSVSPVVNGGGSTNGVTITITVTCPSLPCTITITITGPPASSVSVSSAAAAARKRHAAAALARGRVTIRRHGAQKVTLRLTGAGKRFFRSHHGTVRVNAALSQKAGGKTRKVTKAVRVKIATGKHHGKK